MENKNWFAHVEWAIMMITILGTFFAVHASIDSINSRIDTINNRFDQYMIAAHQEMKDFHGRLCAIEEKNRK